MLERELAIAAMKGSEVKFCCMKKRPDALAMQRVSRQPHKAKPRVTESTDMRRSAKSGGYALRPYDAIDFEVAAVSQREQMIDSGWIYSKIKPEYKIEIFRPITPVYSRAESIWYHISSMRLGGCAFGQILWRYWLTLRPV